MNTPKQTATITLTDNPDGTLGLTMEFEPEITDETHSNAVYLAIACVEQITNSSIKVKPA